MKRYFILVLGMIISAIAYSQPVRNWTEDFEGTVTFKVFPTGSWIADTTYYYQVGTGTPNPKSYLGWIPYSLGDTCILQSPVYDLSNYDFVTLRFSHICKVSPLDVARLEYKRTNEVWRPVPYNAYESRTAANYNTYLGFNAASYTEWQANDSTIFPTQSWWKSELFNVATEVSRDANVEFRFIIIRGKTHGTQISYGWLIDDFQLEGAEYELKPPVVEFLAPLTKDTVGGTGPFEINAKVVTRTSASIVPPYLVYTTIYNGVTTVDSILMTNVAGDSLWKATIKQFPVGTTVSYSITGRDTVGNTDNSGMLTYITALGMSNYVIAGTGTGTSYRVPMDMYWQYSWTRQVYLASELDPASGGGVITRLAWDFAANQGAWTYTNQTCYFRAVDDVSITSTAYENPLALGGELVWSGTIGLGANQPGWVEIILDKPFTLPPGKHLMIYWEHRKGSYYNTYYTWRTTSYSPTRAIYRACDGCSSSLTSGSGTSVDRANARFFITNRPELYNSASVHSIDLNDIIAVSPGMMVPIVVTIKNKGISNLTSAVIKYTVNGGTEQQQAWTGNLAWDMNDQITLNTYTPQVNGSDIIKVWIEQPNGVTDSMTNDDMKTKSVYGSTDISMQFVDFFSDTVRSTGPFAISARISSLSGATIGPIFLNVITTYGGVSNTVSLPMTFDAVNNLWKTTIPQTQYGSDITYSITLTDILTNVIEISDTIYLRRANVTATSSGNVIFSGTGARDDHRDVPIHTYHVNSWSKQLYLESENDVNKRGGMITKLAWEYVTGATAINFNNQTCYMRLVDASVTDLLPDNQWGSYDDPNDATKGMTKVWGPANYTSTSGAAVQWVEITLDVPFIWEEGKNLLIYWYNENTTYTTTNRPYQNCNFGHTNMGTRMVHYTNVDTKPLSSQAPNAGARRNDRANLRLYLEGGSPDTSVALVAIEEPTISVSISQSVPVVVRIANAGKEKLKGCTIEWTINGVPQTSYPWTGNLSEEFTDVVTLGNYQPTQLGKTDTILVWVKDPNGIEDSKKDDDTLFVEIKGCSGSVQGVQPVGASGTFTTIAEALATVRECGLTGDLTLQLDGTYTENVDLTNLTPYLRGHHLTITSLDNNADSVIIKPSSGVGITLGNTRNITIEKITVDRENVSQHAIQFTAACTNIVIRECKLLVNPTVYTNDIASIYKGDATGIVDSIFIIGNTLRGGVANVYFYGGIGQGTNLYGRNTVIDSNICTESYSYGIKTEYTDLLHVSYNYLSPQAYNSAASSAPLGSDRWDAFQLHNSNGEVIGNRMVCLTDRRGEYLHLTDFNHFNTTKRGLIANNELIHISTRRGFGSACDRAIVDMVNNSFYLKCPGTDASLFYFAEPIVNSIYFRNNNVVILPTSGTATLFTNSSVAGKADCDFDYNNFYNQSSTAQLNYHASMQHVISVMPTFVDVNVNLDVSLINTNLYCPLIPSVTTDIRGRPRTGQATMGAYQIIPYSRDLTLKQFVSLDPEVVENQVVQLAIEVENYGNDAIQSAVFGWSVNGQQKPQVKWNPATPLPIFGQGNVTIGTFTVNSNEDNYQIIVWIDSINSLLDMDNQRDTLILDAVKMPLASWVSPFVADTITALTFDVSAKIRTGTGAPIPTPQWLKLTTTINGNYVIKDSVVMSLTDGIWKASVPQQYYGGNVVYSITVTDGGGITHTISDSVYIKYSESTSATYSGHDLAISEMLNPVNDPNDLCTPDVSPVRTIIKNLGANNYDFSRTFIFLYAEVINPQGTRDTVFIIKNTGTLDSKKSDTITLMSSLTVKYAGRYKIKVWMESSLDNVPYDDTLIYEYISGRISLPVDEDFSSGIIPIEQFASEAVNPKVETNVWMPYTDTDGKIVPPEGSGMIIRYAGNGKRGAMTKLTVRQLDLSGSVDPKLEFWYYYDSTANPLDDSYTEIRIVKDYVPEIVLNLLKKDDTYGYGWHLHTVNLNPYKDGECVLIEFESMNKYDLSSQYMSHLQITSTPDLEVFDILISPEMTACDMDNKDIQVVLRTTANQGMDFVNNPTSIAVEIPGMQITPYILQDAIAGNSMDTVTVATGIDLTTVTDIKVYLTAPVDNYSDNDTAFRELDYNPELELTVIPATGNGSCYKKGISVYQRIALKNSGKMDLFGIKMQLILTAGDNFTDTVNEPGTVDLLKDSTLLYDFASSYIVPEEDYTVKVIAWLECAPGRVDVIHAAGECVDLHNLSLISIDSPLDNQIDTMGTTQQISVTLQNTDVLNAFENVDITALVESKQGQVLQTITEVLPRVEPSASPAFTFSEKYTVPSDSLYIVRVYISSGDLYTENDTLFVQGQSIPADTNVGIAYHGNLSGFSLEQNIPNPANNSTRIDYSIPTADDVMFYVHSVNGQLLYAEKISTPRGTHTIELNTAMFAAGIYFYSIEYKGQKRVKKLTINN